MTMLTKGRSRDNCYFFRDSFPACINLDLTNVSLFEWPQPGTPASDTVGKLVLILFPARSTQPAARVVADRVVPEELAPARLRHLPSHYDLDRVREMALAVRIVGGVHEHVLANEVDDRIRE